MGRHVYLWRREEGGVPSVRVLALPPSGTDAQSHARAGSGCSKTSPPSPRRPSERRAGRAAAAAAETRRPSLQSDTEHLSLPRPRGDEACGPHSPAASAARSPRSPRPARLPAPGRTRPRHLSRERRGLRGRTHRASPRRGRSPLPAAPAQPRALGAGRGASAVTGPRAAGRARGGRAGSRTGGAERTGRPGALSGARDFFPEGRGAARRTRTPAPRRGPRVTDRGGSEPPAGGAALRGPRRVQTARVWLRLRGCRGRGAAAEVGGLPGPRLRPPPAQRGEIPGLSGGPGAEEDLQAVEEGGVGMQTAGLPGIPWGKEERTVLPPQAPTGSRFSFASKVKRLTQSPQLRAELQRSCLTLSRTSRFHPENAAGKARGVGVILSLRDKNQRKCQATRGALWKNTELRGIRGPRASVGQHQ